MLKISFANLSRPQRQHIRKGIPGFYSAHLGASFMRFRPIPEYNRSSESLYHHPDQSLMTGAKVDWARGIPHGDLGITERYGRNTLEVKGLPMGNTPEYIQERLRRFFSKFGAVTTCRALNHPLDPYQCEGTAYVAFRDGCSLEAASTAVVRFGSRILGNRVLSLRAVSSGQVMDGKSHIDSYYRSVSRVMEATSSLSEKLSKDSQGISVRSIETNEEVKSAILQIFGSFDEFLKSAAAIFHVDNAGLVHAKRLVQIKDELKNLERSMIARLDASLSQNWRKDKPSLPEYTQRRIDLWDHKDKLPFDLQILSRDFRQYKVHDEKFLVASRKKRERAQAKAENRKTDIAARH